MYKATSLHAFIFISFICELLKVNMFVVHTQKRLESLSKPILAYMDSKTKDF